MTIRNYKNSDYESLVILYKNESLYGGQFDEARDSKEKIQKLVDAKPDAVLVADENGKIVGTVTLFEDGRSAWLCRFAATSQAVASELWKEAKRILGEKGHAQVLVYAPVGNNNLKERYLDLGFSKGNDFTAYWQDLK